MQTSKEEQTTNFNIGSQQQNLFRSSNRKSSSQEKCQKRNYWTSRTKKRDDIYLENNQKHIWKDSASSMTRDISPSHRVPKSRRFSSIQDDTLKNHIFLTLNLRQQIAGKGIVFPKSKRKNHFLNKSNLNTPSAATYHKPRFLDNSFYKRRQQKSQSLKVNVLKIQNPENSQEKKLNYHYLNHNFNSRPISEYSKNLNGRTIATFSNYSKIYLQQGKNIPYQAQLFVGYPGVGSYQIDKSFKKKGAQIKYTMRKILKRFNQINDKCVPGPGKYLEHNNIQKESFLVKKSIPKSNRTYLTNPDNGNPSPANYKIKRWIQE